MQNLLLVIQIVVSVLLVLAILIQSRGTGFGRGSTSSFTRRGAEKIIFKSTFVLAAIFIFVSVLQLSL